MTSPQRIQRRRIKGWRMPDGAVYVGRPTLWGNPYTVQDASHVVPAERRAYIVARYRSELEHLGLLSDWSWVASPVRWQEVADDIRGRGLRSMAAYAPVALAGRDLVCWCPLGQPCHADVLLELANGGAS